MVSWPCGPASAGAWGEPAQPLVAAAARALQEPTPATRVEFRMLLVYPCGRHGRDGAKDAAAFWKLSRVSSKRVLSCRRRFTASSRGSSLTGFAWPTTRY